MEYKKCSKEDHQEWLLCTEENFYKSKDTPDGLCSWCKECYKKATNQRVDKDREEIYRKQRIYQKANLKERNKLTRKWRHNHPEQHYNTQSNWRTKNSDKCNEYSKNKQKHTISKKEWISCKEYFGNKCAYCGLAISEHYYTRKGTTKLGDFHKEHADDEGENDLSNCLPSCGRCNSFKHNSNIEEWYTPNNPIFSQERLELIYKWLNEDYKLYIITK